MSRIHLVKRLAEFTQKPLMDALDAPLKPLALPGPTAVTPSTTPSATSNETPAESTRSTGTRRTVRHSAALTTSRAVRTAPNAQDLYVWFEDTSSRLHSSRRGIAGLPESLLPYARGMRVVERHYVEGHLHLLAAVRLRCGEQLGERISALYTAALSVGTVAWIGTGAQYARAWQEMYP